MTIREMIDAMLAGKTLIRPNGATAYYDPDDANCGPWVFVWGNKARMVDAWYYTYWSIKPEPKKRLMTREEAMGFCLHTPGIVVRIDVGVWSLPKSFVFSVSTSRYDWAIMDIHGRVIDGPHTFEVEDEGVE